MTAAITSLALSFSRAFLAVSSRAQVRSGMMVWSHHGVSTQTSDAGAGGSDCLGILVDLPT
jgi:hypothetical protein